MAKYQRKPKINIPMYAAVVLFYLTAISTYMVSGLYARYTTSGVGSDTARVITFGDVSITETGDFADATNDMLIVPGHDLTKKAVVNFSGSEAATYVFVEVILSHGWTVNEGTFSFGSQLQWQIAEGWEQLEWTELNRYVFCKALGPNEVLAADIIKDGKITVSDAITSIPNCTISFRASVVQSHGFTDHAQAWASIKAKEGAA